MDAAQALADLTEISAQIESAVLAQHDGSVFVAKDERHLVAAVTKPRPTVGLVFYDLKTCLRMLEREEEAKAAKATETATKTATSRRTTTKKKTEEADAESS